ncbi:MAG: AAA family ATPase [Flavobacteriales bacterium]|nr:AAA family ATPase [Flavobacteriales bacterium]NUM51881.1 AAA family ATPase [Flavobacteriales bacterium]
MPEQKHLIILRGLPGAGKTTLAHVLSENGKYPIFSVDDFFTDAQTGKYTFVFSENHIAYHQCLKHCEKAMKENVSKIILHNVFSMQWEIEPYFKLAEQYNYTLHIATVEKHHTHSNTHSITDEQIKKMAKNFKLKLF